MAVLPLGTFNHFAKDLDIPLDVEEAVVLACQGEARPVDIAEVNGRVFINHSAIGIYPYMLREREERRARFGHGKWRAMVVATAKALHDYPLLGFRVRVGDEALVRRSPFLFIGNNRYINRSYGLVEDSQRNSLTLVIAHDTGRLGLARIALKSLLGRVHGETALDRFELTSAVVESRRRHLLVGIDGELVEIAPPLRYRLLPAALRVVQPRRRPKARTVGELSADATVGDDIGVTRGEGRPWTGNGSPEIGRNSRDASASAGAS
jgi:diacylglycerol kinase family enzyme